MTINTLNLIKNVETKIATMNAASIAAITNEINNIENTIGSYIADQLKNAQWAQARALGLI